MIVDMHTHFVPSAWPDLEARFQTGNWPRLEHTAPGEARIMLGGKEFRRVNSAVWDPSVRLGDMDRDEIDIQIISATPVLFAYGQLAAQAYECARLFNDAALEICAAAPTRLKALCQVPLQDADLACRTVTEAMAAGHIGVQIGNHVGSTELCDDQIVTFLQHCATIGAPVFVHPWDMMGRERYQRHLMPWLVGMPAETQLSILSLIFSGVFERLPSSLRICFAHAGGSFAYLIGRADNAWQNRADLRAECPNLPSSYASRFYVDSAIFHDDALSLLLKVMSVDRVMLGSDYPYPLGEQRVGSLIRAHRDLTSNERAKLLGQNALRFFGLE